MASPETWHVVGDIAILLILNRKTSFTKLGIFTVACRIERAVHGIPELSCFFILKADEVGVGFTPESEDERIVRSLLHSAHVGLPWLDWRRWRNWSIYHTACWVG